MPIALRAISLATVLLGIATSGAQAGLEEVEEGVYVDDFEDGMLLDWELGGGTDAEIDEGEDNSLLDVRGAGELTLSDMEFSDFAADASFDTPYWVSMPTNGDTGHEAYFQFPSPAQHRGYMHLCMAYGAKGMLLYSLQNQFGVGIVDTVTLEPNGENLSAIGEVAGNIKKHAKLLLSLKVGGFDVRCQSPDIEPVPLHDGKDGRYVYVINRNTKERVNCRLFWPARLGRGKVKDLYADEDVQTESDESYVRVSLELAPGEGRLLAVEKGQ